MQKTKRTIAGHDRILRNTSDNNNFLPQIFRAEYYQQLCVRCKPTYVNYVAHLLHIHCIGAFLSSFVPPLLPFLYLLSSATICVSVYLSSSLFISICLSIYLFAYLPACNIIAACFSTFRFKGVINNRVQTRVHPWLRSRKIAECTAVTLPFHVPTLRSTHENFSLARHYGRAPLS